MVSQNNLENLSGKMEENIKELLDKDLFTAQGFINLVMEVNTLDNLWKIKEIKKEYFYIQKEYLFKENGGMIK